MRILLQKIHMQNAPCVRRRQRQAWFVAFHVGGLFSWELSSCGSSLHMPKQVTPPKPLHRQSRTNASCVPKPDASRNAFPNHTHRRVPLGPINRHAKRECFSIIQVQKARKKRANNSCKHEIRQRGKAEHFHTKHKRSKRRSCCRTEGCN